MGEENFLLPQQRNRSKGNTTWYGGVTKNGVTKWVSLKTRSQKKAMDWYNEKQAGRYLPKESKPVTLKIGDAAKAYLEDICKVRRRAKGTIKEYEKHLRVILDWSKEKNIMEVTEFTPQIGNEFSKENLSTLAGSSAKSRIVLLRSFFRWVAFNYDVNLRNPFQGILTPKAKPEPRKFWTIEECEQIIEAANDSEVKCWFAFMAFAGLRKEEARFLKMENIEGGKITLIGKGGKLANLPISPRLKEYLKTYLLLRGENAGYLFPALAKRCTKLERFIYQAAAKAKASNADTAHYHRFRHSFASNLLRSGVGIKAVQMLMRHENVTLTLNIYGHLLPSDLEKELEKL